MDPSTKPETICSAKAQTPVPAPVPATPYGSHCTQSPLTGRSPCTPGSGTLNACTLDESLFIRVAVHTAKCTECDKRNLDTMRRCPGCTFQVCQPCYQKREEEGKGLVHGNTPTPGSTPSATSNGSTVRTARKKPVESISPPESQLQKLNNDMQEPPVENAAPQKDSGPSTAMSNIRKRAARQSASENYRLEQYSEDKSDPEDVSPTPKKRPRTDVPFAESALVTAVKEPLTTLATRQSNRADTHEAITSATLQSLSLQPPATEPPIRHATRSPSLAATHGATASAASKKAKPRSAVEHAHSEPMQIDILYENAVEGYREPLLARCQPVLSNPVAHIPAIVRRGGKPRPSAEQIYQNIQQKVHEKLSKANESVISPAEALLQLSKQITNEETASATRIGEPEENKQAFTAREHMKNVNMPTVRDHAKNQETYTVRNHVEIQQAPAFRQHMNNEQASSVQQYVQNAHVGILTAHTFHDYTTTTPAYTVRDFVQQEAIKYQNNPLLDQDDKEALFNVLQSGALIWGKQAYNKQAPEAQRLLLPGLNLRLDAIDGAYTAELQVLMAEQAARMMQDLTR